MSRIRPFVDWVRRIHRCPACRQDSPPAELRQWGACGGCIGPAFAAQQLARHRQVWLRLIAKHHRYKAIGARTAATDASLIRVTRRMEQEIARWPAELRSYGYSAAASWLGIDLRETRLLAAA